MKALLVEPSRFLCSVIGSILARHNIDCETVEDGAQALSALAAQHRDLICFALELGDMRGTEFFREAGRRGLVERSTALMITSNHDRAVCAEALAVGVTDCFLKSDLESFEQYIEQWERSASRRLSGRVLLVEDSATAAKFYTEIMVSLGLDVSCFKTAEQAIESFLSDDYQIVVTDFVLDGFQTGLSLIRCVRSQPGKKGKVPIIALSAGDNAARRIDVLRAGANDFVGKPVVPEELAARLGNLLMLRELWDRLEVQHELLKEMALRDRLTSLHNRHFLDSNIPRLLDSARNRRAALALAVVDIDHFKVINDRHGHYRGDEVLVALAKLLRDACRSPQEVIRYGGEEFLLIFPDTGAEQALQIANDLRERVALAPIPGGIALTVSIGIATLNDDDDFDRLFSRADAALYEAKRRGRNCVLLFP